MTAHDPSAGERARQERSDAPRSKDATEYAARLFPCEPPCDSYGVCSNCIEQKIFFIGYGFGYQAALQSEFERGRQEGLSQAEELAHAYRGSGFGPTIEQQIRSLKAGPAGGGDGGNDRVALPVFKIRIWVARGTQGGEYEGFVSDPGAENSVWVDVLLCQNAGSVVREATVAHAMKALLKKLGETVNTSSPKSEKPSSP